MMKQTILFGIIVGFTVGRPSVQLESGSRKLQRTENREEMELFPIGKSHDMVFRSGYSRMSSWIFLFIRICLFKQREGDSLGL